MSYRAGAELPPGEEPPARGPGIGARTGEMERVAQARFVLGAAGARDAHRRGAERQAFAPHARPGRVFPDGGVDAGKRCAGEEGGFGLALRRIDRARPGGKRRRLGGRRPRHSERISAVEHARRLPHGGAFA
jgi:hypothetical protein